MFCLLFCCCDGWSKYSRPTCILINRTMGCSFGNCMWPNNYFDGFMSVNYKEKMCIIQMLDDTLFSASWELVLDARLATVKFVSLLSRYGDRNWVISAVSVSDPENWEFHKLVWSELSCISMDKHSARWNSSIKFKEMNKLLLVNSNLVSGMTIEWTDCHCYLL